MPFLLLEISLYCVGWTQADGLKDPYVGFVESSPLFNFNPSTDHFEVADSRKPLFCADSFSAKKSSNEFRVFCVGGSTVQGRPFAIETAFSTWLELNLTAADDSKSWNVINCGGVSYASYRLAPIVEEIVGYDPDLIVLYTGHNEFLEDRTYESVKSTSPWVAGAHRRLSHLKSYSFLRDLAVSKGESNQNRVPQLSKEVEARLDFRNGLEKYRRDDMWRQSVVRHFEHNLRRMLTAAKSANVPLVLCNPVSNLRDASPFKSENREDMSAEELERFQEIWKSVREDENQGLSERRAELEKLALLDPLHAEVHYRLGQIYQMQGEFDKAKIHLVEAKEQDVCPLRIVEPMYEVINQVKEDFDVSWVDVKACFEKKAVDGIPGRRFLVDHVHPSIRGHQLIADLLVEEMIKEEMVRKKENYEERRIASYQNHLESLSHLYFQLGKDRLAGLKRWAKGEVTKRRDDRVDEPARAQSPNE